MVAGHLAERCPDGARIVAAGVERPTPRRHPIVRCHRGHLGDRAVNLRGEQCVEVVTACDRGTHERTRRGANDDVGLTQIYTGVVQSRQNPDIPGNAGHTSTTEHRARVQVGLCSLVMVVVSSPDLIVRRARR